jgi:hypothetical protein
MGKGTIRGTSSEYDDGNTVPEATSASDDGDRWLLHTSICKIVRNGVFVVTFVFHFSVKRLFKTFSAPVNIQ